MSRHERKIKEGVAITRMVRGRIEATPGPAASAARPARPSDARAVSGARLLALQRTAGNRAVTRLLQRATPGPPGDPPGPPHRPVGDIARDLARARREADAAVLAGEDLLREAGVKVPVDERELRRALRDLERRGNARARGVLDALRRAHEEEERLFEEWLRAQQHFRPPGGAGGKEPAAKAAEKEAGKEAEKTVEKEAVKAAEKEAVKEAGETVAKKAGEAAAERAGTGGVFRRVAAKIGIELLDALVPDPLDALMLMVDFAKSFTEARDAIRRRNLEDGFAVGWAAYLVVPRWDWARWFALTAASQDVATQVVGAVGVAENAFNEGLVRGFIYGEKHTTAQADRVRQKAFDAVLKVTGHSPGRSDGDDLYTFGRDDVYSFAGALHAAAVEVLKEADKRRAARLEEERRKAWEESHWEAGRVGMKV